MAVRELNLDDDGRKIASELKKAAYEGDIALLTAARYKGLLAENFENVFLRNNTVYTLEDLMDGDKGKFVGRPFIEYLLRVTERKYASRPLNPDAKRFLEEVIRD